MQSILLLIVFVLAAIIPFYAQAQVGELRLTLNVLLTTTWAVLLAWNWLRLAGRAQERLKSIVHMIPYFWIWAGFVVWSALTIAIGPEIQGPAQGIWHVYRDAVEMPLIYGLLALTIQDAMRLMKAIYIFIAASTLTALIGIIQSLTNGALLTGLGPGGNLRYLGFLFPYPSEMVDVIQRADPQMLQFVEPTTGILRATGGLAGDINLGAFLLLPIGLTLAFLIRATAGRFRLIWGIALFIMCTSVGFTYSRGAWLALAAIVVLFGFLALRPSRRWNYAWAICGLLALLAAGSVFWAEARVVQTRLQILAQEQPGVVPPNFLTAFVTQSRTGMTLTEYNENNQITGRAELWAYAARQIIASPIIGYGTVQVPIAKWWGVNPSPHEMFLAIGYSRGLIGLVLFVVLLGLLLRDAWRFYLSVPRGLGLGFLLALVGFSIAGLFVSVITYGDTGYAFWFVAGLGQIAGRMAATKSNDLPVMLKA